MPQFQTRLEHAQHHFGALKSLAAMGLFLKQGLGDVRTPTKESAEAIREIAGQIRLFQKLYWPALTAV